MIALAIVLGLVLAAVVAGLMWRWLDVQERVRVEQAKAGGAELARTVAALTERVAQFDAYINPTSYDIESSGFHKWLLDHPDRPYKDDPPLGRRG